MRRTSFLWVLYASYAVLILLTTTIAGVLLSRQQRQDAMAEVEQNLTSAAQLSRDVAVPREGENATRYQARIREAGVRAGVRLTVIDTTGTVVADSVEDAAGMNDHSTRPEILQASERQTGSATRYSSTIGTDMMYVAVAVPEGAHHVAFVRTSVPLTEINERLSQTRLLIAASAGIAALVGLLIGALFARLLTRRLTRLTKAAEALAAGEYELELPIGSRDEFGRLAVAFNDMARQLKERMDTIVSDRNQVVAILTSMTEGVIAVDARQNIVHINAAAAAMLGVNAADCIGQPVWKAVRVSALNEAADAVLETGSDDRREARITGESETRELELRTAPLRDSRGEVAGAVLVLSDFTDLRRLETVRTDFVSNVSHELKTPLAAIQALVETLIDDETIDPTTRADFLGRIAKQSRRLNTIVLDLLSLSRMEAEGKGLERKPIDLRTIVSECIELCRETSQKAGITLACQLPASPVRVFANDEAMKQLLGNLLDNALKYTPGEGRVEVRVSTDNGDAVVEVEDTGAGIEASHLPRIFERFYRVDRARSRELGGTGLGLAIVKHVALAHGGAVRVSSTPGKGSTFVVSLPLAQR